MKKVIGLRAASGSETLDDLLRAWSAANGVQAANPKVIRAIGLTYTVQIEVDEQQDVSTHITIPVDLSRDQSLSPFAIATLKDRYLLKHEQSPQEAFGRAAVAFADNEDHAKRLYDYVSRGWFMFATPVLSNAPLRKSWGASFDDAFTSNRFAAFRGLPISCFLNYVPDSREGLTAHYTENAWLSSVGGGVGGYWGAIRSNGTETKAGSKSSGVMPFMKVVDSEVMAFAQGVTRRASYAAYLDISHPEVVEFLDMRKPTGGDANRKCLNLHHGINIPDAFMEIIEDCMRNPHADDSWPLVDPHSQRIVETVSAKELWQRILDLRVQTGEPYLHFIDASNRTLPKAQRDAGLRVHQSNLCSEITLPTNEERTAVCCLSSVNLEQFDAWSKVPSFIEDLIRMLDNVLEFFIRNAPDTLGKAKYSAMMERSVGLGAMGFHSLLQSKGLPFESALATSVNRQVFAHIAREAGAATLKLAQERGPCPDAKGEMRRNMHLTAVAPNASSSILCGTSPSIEPERSNAFTQKTQSGSWLVKNCHLAATLEAYGRNDEDTWQHIILNKGSVQDLDFLTEHERDVFKTAMEIDQRWIVEQASQRGEFIDQSQSVNVFFPANAQISYLHFVHLMAWKKGLKSLYYLRSEAVKRADTVSFKVERAAMENTETVCLSCEG